MIYFNFKLDNPFRHNKTKSKDYVYKERVIAKNKSVELQISKWGAASSLFTLELDLRWKGQDHAGPSIMIEVWKYFFNLKIYDHRHWDYENQTWEVYSEELHNE